MYFGLSSKKTNKDWMGCIPTYRRFRIEYGFECGCPEGVIYLPPEVDPDVVERFLDIIIPRYEGCKKWKMNED